MFYFINKYIKGPIASILAVLFLLLFIFLSYKISLLNSKFGFLALLMLLFGLLYETFRIANDKKEVINIFIMTFFFSFFSFLPGKHEIGYNMSNHFEDWPYYFVFIYGLYATGSLSDKVTVNLTEGITLIHTLSFLYWLYDVQFFNHTGLFYYILYFIIGLFTLFTILSSLTYYFLNTFFRFILSIWSSVIMMVLAVDNVWKVYVSGFVSLNTTFLDYFFYALKFFLLGISFMYIVQNIIMVLGFLPDRDKFFNRDYFQSIKDLKKKHIKRYSENQVQISYAIICIVVLNIIYISNIYYSFVSRNMLIWMVILLYPYFNLFISRFFNKGLID